MMFWADNYTSSEFVGFVDTDAVFLTYIDREDLFEDGKPVVNARSGKLLFNYFSVILFHLFYFILLIILY